MKRTRKELVEFLNHLYYTYPKTTQWADKLISEGWVKVEEPREFWIIEEPGVKCPSCFKTEEHAKEFVHYKRKIIHVREVISDE